MISLKLQMYLDLATLLPVKCLVALYAIAATAACRLGCSSVVLMMVFVALAAGLAAGLAVGVESLAVAEVVEIAGAVCQTVTAGP